MYRVLSVWLPQLPLDRLVRKADPRLESPFALIREQRQAWQLTHLNHAAKQQGLSAGLSLADAQAICPQLLTTPCEPERERLLLQALWRWADCLSPRVATEPPDGLVLDISGCAHLFGGEKAMARHTRRRLADLQVASRVAIADTRRAAWALSRCAAEECSIAPSGQTVAALEALPLAGLRLSPNVLRALRRAGLTQIGQLYAIRPAELARRFGLDLVTALNAALGQSPDPVVAQAVPRPCAARMSLPEPIGLLEDLERVVMRLAESVCRRLSGMNSGARRFELTVRCVDSGDHLLSIGFARPCQDAQAVCRQLQHPLQGLKIVFGADWFRLQAQQIEPVQPRQTGFDREACVEDDVALLLSTLGNRLGFDRIRRFIPRASHLPEHSFVREPVGDYRAEIKFPEADSQRPLRLYWPPQRVQVIERGRPPAQFVWSGKAHALVRQRGPERLAPEWWSMRADHLRDYWWVQTTTGLRLWLLNYPGVDTAAWYVAGRFA